MILVFPVVLVQQLALLALSAWVIPILRLTLLPASDVALVQALALLALLRRRLNQLTSF
jgi:hypothetical protein